MSQPDRQGPRSEQDQRLNLRTLLSEHEQIVPVLGRPVR
jgi:hypothetical protein